MRVLKNELKNVKIITNLGAPKSKYLQRIRSRTFIIVGKKLRKKRKEKRGIDKAVASFYRGDQNRLSGHLVNRFSVYRKVSSQKL